MNKNQDSSPATPVSPVCLTCLHLTCLCLTCLTCLWFTCLHLTCLTCLLLTCLCLTCLRLTCLTCLRLTCLTCLSLTCLRASSCPVAAPLSGLVAQPSPERSSCGANERRCHSAPCWPSVSVGRHSGQQRVSPVCSVAVVIHGDGHQGDDSLSSQPVREHHLLPHIDVRVWTSKGTGGGGGGWGS